MSKTNIYFRIFNYRSSGEYDEFDDELAGEGDAEDPDRLVIADEHAARTIENNKQKQDMAMGLSGGTGDPKSKGDKPPRKKHSRFNGMSEEEVAKKVLPDLITPDLDILIVSVKCS